MLKMLNENPLLLIAILGLLSSLLRFLAVKTRDSAPVLSGLLATLAASLPLDPKGMGEGVKQAVTPKLPAPPADPMPSLAEPTSGPADQGEGVDHSTR